MWPDPAETQRLIEQARDGQAHAVDRLLDNHRDPLRRMIAHRLDRAVARRVAPSDVVQEVLLEAHRRMADYLNDSPMPFHLWVRQLAQDRMIDAHRRHRGAARRSVDREQPLMARFGDRSSLELAQQLKDPELTPAALAIRRELQRRFLCALDQLDDVDREIVTLRHLEQLSNSEVAAVLSLSPPAAGMRYLRAVRRLREILAERPSNGTQP